MRPMNNPSLRVPLVLTIERYVVADLQRVYALGQIDIVCDQ